MSIVTLYDSRFNINGTPNDYLGTYTSLSSDGTRLAILYRATGDTKIFT